MKLPSAEFHTPLGCLMAIRGMANDKSLTDAKTRMLIQGVISGVEDALREDDERMVVHRCDTCKHWHVETYLGLDKNWPEYRVCAVASYALNGPAIACSVENDSGGELMTKPDFGCVLWEGH